MIKLRGRMMDEICYNESGVKATIDNEFALCLQKAIIMGLLEKQLLSKEQARMCVEKFESQARKKHSKMRKEEVQATPNNE